MRCGELVVSLLLFSGFGVSCDGSLCLCWMSVDGAQDSPSRLWSVELFIVLLSWSLVRGDPCAIVASRLVSIVLPATAFIIAEQLKRNGGSIDVLCCLNVDDECVCRVRGQLTIAVFAHSCR